MSKLTLRVENTDFLSKVTRPELDQENNASYAIPPERWRTWDAMETNLPGTAAADDLELTTGTLGTDFPCIQTGDFGGTSITRYAACTVELPPEYVAGETVTIRVSGGMLTTVADTSCVIDFEAYPNDGDATASGDICTTAAQDINSLTFANKDFTLTPTSLAPGSQLHIRMAITAVDSGDAGVMIAAAGKVAVLCDIKG